MEYALITGATSGIGFELSVLYAQNGYGLVLVSSSKEHLENTENRLNPKRDKQPAGNGKKPDAV